jgi:hypothetical protein
MGLQHHWFDPGQHIILVKITPPWTWTEYLATIQQVAEEIKHTNQSTAAIVDVSDIGGVPDGSILANIRAAGRLTPEQLDISVLVGAPLIITTFLNVLTRIDAGAKRRIHFAATIDEAVAMIHAHRAKPT